MDAEEAGRLELSLEVIESVLADPLLKGWDGFGVVVQAYNRRAPNVLDWLYDLAKRLDRKIMVRLVKGAYWDTEIKHAQVEGHRKFPVYTRKEATDFSYICCAQKLLGMTDRIYPQFATHNAHTVAAILEMQTDKSVFEFQRLHGMGEALHDTVLRRQGTRCRIYAPVGAHKDLLAYLVRRLLENGANSSFVNQIVDEDVPPEEVAADPFGKVLATLPDATNPNIRQPSDLFAPERWNSAGWDLQDPSTVERLAEGIAALDDNTWVAKGRDGDIIEIRSPPPENRSEPPDFVPLSPWKELLTPRNGGISLRKSALAYSAKLPACMRKQPRNLRPLDTRSRQDAARLRRGIARGGGFFALLFKRVRENRQRTGRAVHLHFTLEFPPRYLHRPDFGRLGDRERRPRKASRNHTLNR